jgi:hypothetical protein
MDYKEAFRQAQAQRGLAGKSVSGMRRGAPGIAALGCSLPASAHVCMAFNLFAAALAQRSSKHPRQQPRRACWVQTKDLVKAAKAKKLAEQQAAQKAAAMPPPASRPMPPPAPRSSGPPAGPGPSSSSALPSDFFDAKVRGGRAHRPTCSDCVRCRRCLQGFSQLRGYSSLPRVAPRLQAKPAAASASQPAAPPAAGSKRPAAAYQTPKAAQPPPAAGSVAAAVPKGFFDDKAKDLQARGIKL